MEISKVKDFTFSESQDIVFGYRVMGNQLWYEKKKEVWIPICRQVPILSKKYKYLETGKTFYEISWDDHGAWKNVIVPALQISSRKELILLADDDLAVTDVNSKELVQYFDRYIDEYELSQGYLSSRIGYIKGHLIHPNILDDAVKVQPAKGGPEQVLEAFQEMGTVDSWGKEVFGKVRDVPDNVFYILGSFASVLVALLDVESFIIDYSGRAGKGKSTLLKVAATVWGKFGLVGSWADNLVQIERKAEFLNSYPILLDDSKNARNQNAANFEQLVYFFVGGQTKGRGNLKGFQANSTWKNVLLSNGESSLLDYTESGGTARRVVILTGTPISEDTSTDPIYKAMRENYGVVGRVFVEKLKEMNEDELARIQKIYTSKKEQLFRYITGNDNVAKTLASHYAVVHTAGVLVNKFFNFGLELTFIDELYKRNLENATVDKNKQQLFKILERADGNRNLIWYSTQPPNYIAIDRKGEFCLVVDAVNQFLGKDANEIKNYWKEKGWVLDLSKQVKKNGHNIRCNTLNPDILKEWGFDFSYDPDKNI
ncbi:DUF927 domain-containing protein [Neobacillus cucumis]|uniref:DUF927 domain-containing protein n=1 Tax=Neobacillus cucumis TaxID=1740721 RepID=A0A2N5H8U8_9BACI|nr:DUF927 domain-containing protein [Neobacillus cucumis]PLS01931.1 hypothetical protein CVD27_22710 [Neobacillus cucumis]